VRSESNTLSRWPTSALQAAPAPYRITHPNLFN